MKKQSSWVMQVPASCLKVEMILGFITGIPTSAMLLLLYLPRTIQLVLDQYMVYAPDLAFSSCNPIFGLFQQYSMEKLNSIVHCPLV